jgi:hypothetical protein
LVAEGAVRLRSAQTAKAIAAKTRGFMIAGLAAGVAPVDGALRLIA